MRTPLGLLGINVGHLWHAIVGVALGGINWTIATAGKFVLNTLAGVVKLLIPTSWIHAGVRVMQWLVSVPDYSARIAGPNGTHVYGFAGINDLRALMTWVAIAVLPLSLTIGAGRGLIGKDHPALPIARTVCVAGVVIFYGTLWSQGAALANQLTHLILSLPAVTHGIQNLFTLVLGGGVLSGFAFIGVIVTGATAAGLMAFVFVKVVVILAGAVVYAIGPLMIGLAPTRAGEALARTWASAAIALIALPVAWAFVFATAALLMYDSFTGAAGLVGSSSTLGQLLGGLSLALAGIAGFYLNIKLTRAVAALLGGQLIAMLAVVRAETHGGARSATGASGAGARPGGASASLQAFGARVAGATRGAGGALVGDGRVGVAASGAATLARGGLLGAAAAGSRRVTGAAAASRPGRAIGGTRAGALATRAARAGRAGWQNANIIAASPAASGRRAGGTPARGGAGANDGERGARPTSATASSSPDTGAATQRGRGQRTTGTPASETTQASRARGGGAAQNASGRPAAQPTRTPGARAQSSSRRAEAGTSSARTATPGARTSQGNAQTSTGAASSPRRSASTSSTRATRAAPPAPTARPPAPTTRQAAPSTRPPAPTPRRRPPRRDQGGAR